MIRVVIVDDHAIVRQGIRTLLEMEDDILVVGEADDGGRGLQAVARHQPDVLLLDLTMPGSSGLQIIGRVRSSSPYTRVLVVSMHVAPEFVRGACQAGATGYVDKGSGLDDLVRAVRLVANGERVAPTGMAGIESIGVTTARTTVDDLERLTPREKEVLQLVAEGHTNREISDRLGVTAKTVDVHRTNLMRKLDLHTAQALTRFAVRHGVVSAE